MWLPCTYLLYALLNMIGASVLHLFKEIYDVSIKSAITYITAYFSLLNPIRVVVINQKFDVVLILLYQDYFLLRY